MTTDSQYHRLYPDEFEDARIAAAGAYRGTHAATGDHIAALSTAVEEAFNAGVEVGKRASDGEQQR